MSYILKTGETVSLNSLASRKATTPVVLSNSEKVRKNNDLTALHVIMKIRGV